MSILDTLEKNSALGSVAAAIAASPIIFSSVFAEFISCFIIFIKFGGIFFREISKLLYSDINFRGHSI